MKKLDDIIDDWRSTFGRAEYEQAARQIVTFLKSDFQIMDASNDERHLKKTGWGKPFFIESFSSPPSIFASMVYLGWIVRAATPEWAFVVTESFIERCPTQPHEERK